MSGPVDGFDKPAPPEENPYASPQESTSAAYHPSDAPWYQPHRGALVLVLGILGLLLALFASVCCGIFGVFSLGLSLPAWIMGRTDLRAINAGAMDPAGRGMTVAGMVMGIVATAITALWFLFMVGMIVLMLVSETMS